MKIYTSCSRPGLKEMASFMIWLRLGDRLTVFGLPLLSSSVLSPDPPPHTILSTTQSVNSFTPFRHFYSLFCVGGRMVARD